MASLVIPRLVSVQNAGVTYVSLLDHFSFCFLPCGGLNSGLHHSPFISLLIISLVALISPPGTNSTLTANWIISPWFSLLIHLTKYVFDIFLHSASASPRAPVCWQQHHFVGYPDTQLHPCFSFTPRPHHSSFTVVSPPAPSCPSHCYCCPLAEPPDAIPPPLQRAQPSVLQWGHSSSCIWFPLTRLGVS